VRSSALIVSSILALAVLVAATPAPAEESTILTATEDAYVVTDISSATDSQGLRDKNFGNLDFVKVWYEFQVQAQEQMLSVGLFKFDLSAIADKELHSTHLQLFAVRADLTEAARLIDVSLAEGAWSQDQVTFTTLPQVVTPPLSTAAVYAANVWYSWDISPGAVRKQRDGSMSLAVGLRSLENKKEEQVVFASSRAGRNAPRLLVTYAASAPSLPLSAVPAGIGVAAGLAILAFVIGLLLGRRRKQKVAAILTPAHDETEAEPEAAALPR
jgi:hypothetical protein